MDLATNTKDKTLVLDGIVSFVNFVHHFIPEIKLDLNLISPILKSHHHLMSSRATFTGCFAGSLNVVLVLLRNSGQTISM